MTSHGKCNGLVAVYFRAKQSASGDVLLDGLKSLVLIRQSQLEVERQAAIATEVAGEAKQLAQAAMKQADANHGYFTLLGFAVKRRMEMPVGVAGQHGKRLTAICAQRGIPVHHVNDTRWGLVNTYPESILEEYFRDA